MDVLVIAAAILLAGLAIAFALAQGAGRRGAQDAEAARLGEQIAGVRDAHSARSPNGYKRSPKPTPHLKRP